MIDSAVNLDWKFLISLGVGIAAIFLQPIVSQWITLNLPRKEEFNKWLNKLIRISVLGYQIGIAVYSTFKAGPIDKTYIVGVALSYSMLTVYVVFLMFRFWMDAASRTQEQLGDALKLSSKTADEIGKKLTDVMVGQNENSTQLAHRVKELHSLLSVLIKSVSTMHDRISKLEQKTDQDGNP